MASAANANGSGTAARAPAESPRLEVRDVVRTIQKRRWLVVIVLIVVTLVGGVIGVMAPRHYAATSLVLIHAVPPGFFWLGEDGDTPPAPEVSVQTQARLVATLENAQKAAEELAKRPGGGIHVSPAKILNSTTVEVEEPDILRITVADTDSDHVVPMANTLSRVYVDAARERGRGIFGEAGDFLEKQIADVQAKLDALNKQKLELLEKGGIADVPLAIENAETLFQQLRQDRDRAHQELQGVRQSLGPLRRAVAAEPAIETLPTQRPNTQREFLQQDFNEKMRQLAEYRSRYTEQHPLVQSALEEVDELQRRLDAVPERLPDTLYRPNPKHDDALSALRAAEAQEAGLTAQVQAMNEALGRLDRETEGFPRAQVEMDSLNQETEVARDGYRRLVEMLQDHQLRQASRTGVAELADQASVPKAITAPLIRTLVFSVLLGLFCGIALALLLEALDTTIRSPDEVARQTGLPLLGAIPLLEDTSPQVVTLSAPQSPASEAYRTLRSNISFALTDLPARSFLVAGTLGGEGKSGVAANLAVVSAHAGQMVILVGTDLRKPALADLLGCDPGRGLTNVLVGEAALQDVLQDTGVPGLRLLASGPLPPNPAELLDSARMTELIDELHKLADVVIFDSPPALLLADAIILSSKVDRVLLVAESGRVTVDAFREVTRLMHHARASLLGVVLNRYRVPTAGYYQYYYEEPPTGPVRLVAPGETDEDAGRPQT